MTKEQKKLTKEVDIQWNASENELEWIAMKLPNIHTLCARTSFVSVTCMKHLIRTLVFLKNIDVLPKGDPQDWADLLNDSVVIGKPSFGHSVIEHAPKKYLNYPRQMYSLPQ